MVAIKVRRSDSKRQSLSWEALWASKASRAGAAPRIHYWSDNVIVMDLVAGYTLGYLLDQGALENRHIKASLDAARALDAADVLHHELSRPWRHVYITGLHAIIIDYDSASNGCGNVPKLLSGILHGLPGGIVLLKQLRPLLSRYRRLGCPFELYYEISNALEYFFGFGFAGGNRDTL